MGDRSHSRSKGDRCREFVSREVRAKRGLALCAKHFALFQEDVAKDAATRKALRARLDPGPLPLEGE